MPTQSQTENQYMLAGNGFDVYRSRSFDPARFGTGTATQKAFQKQLTATRVLAIKKTLPGDYKTGSVYRGEGNPLADTANWNTGGRKQSKGPMDPMMMALYAGAALLVVFLVVKK